MEAIRHELDSTDSYSWDAIVQVACDGSVTIAVG